MIGVDVIDRSCSFQLNGKHSFKDYASRIINHSEMSFCNNWQDLDMIWAIKESAYKCYYKKHGQEFLNPKKIRITQLDKGTSTFRVEIAELYFSGHYKVTDDYVFAITTDQEDFAKEVELFFLDRYVNASQIQAEFKNLGTFRWNKSGFPDAIQSAGSVYAYSRSHHGRYYFSAICLTPYN